MSAGFIYSDWVDKVRPPSDKKTVSIDLTKYYIQNSSDCSGGLNCTAHVNHEHISSASVSALNASHLDDKASHRLHSVADSAPNISALYHGHPCKKSRDHSYCQLEVWHPNRRGHEVRDPPVSSPTKTDIATSDLNLTNSMTSLIQSGSTSFHAWPAVSTSATSLAQAGARKPPKGRGRPAKRTTPRLQSDDVETPTACHIEGLRQPTSAVCPPNRTQLSVSEPSIDGRGKHPQSTMLSVFSPPPDSARDHRSRSSVKPRPPTNRPREQPMPAAVVHDAPTSSKHHHRNLVHSVSFCPPDDAQRRVERSPVPAASVVTSSVSTQRPNVQDRRRCVSHSDCTVAHTSSPLATNGSLMYYQQNMIVEPHLCSQPYVDVSLVTRNEKNIQSGKTVSLVDVTSGRRVSNSDTESRFIVAATSAASSPRDVIAETRLIDTAGSHESLSDDGYYTKDSGSTTSLNRTQFSFRGSGLMFYSYL